MAGKTKRITVSIKKKDGSITNETRDVYARGLWNTQEIRITGSVAGHGTTDFEDGKGVEFAVEQQESSIAEKHITDGSVTLSKIAETARNGNVQDNDSKLATHAAVKTYVDAKVAGKGTYLGKKSVAEINALDSSTLNNSDRVMTSDAGTISLGGFDVVAGADLILFKDGNTIRWDSMDGNFKTRQNPISSPITSGEAIEFIDNISQNENGDISVTKKSVRESSQSSSGLMSSADKKKLDGISSGANKITVDSALSSSSTNPVQNKVVKAALDGKQAKMTAITDDEINALS